MVTTHAETDEFKSLLKQVSEGSEAAAWRLVEEYGPYIIRTVRRMLDADIRRRFDSRDFVQAVWASFFTGRTDLLRLETPEQLVAYLTAMARNKIVTEVRRLRLTKKYNVNRELKYDNPSDPVIKKIPSREPTPSQMAMAREQWERLMQQQPFHYQQIVKLRLRGETYRRIADQLELSDKTVRRVLTKLLREKVA